MGVCFYWRQKLQTPSYLTQHANHRYFHTDPPLWRELRKANAVIIVKPPGSARHARGSTRKTP